MDATAWDDRYAATERVWSVGPNAFVEEHLADLAPGVAVDLAAGEGRNAIWLASRGWTVTAIDYSSVAIARGQSSGVDVSWQVADVLEAPLPQGLDLALIAYLQLPHDQMASVVARAWAALAPGGTFFMVAHDASNLTEGVGGPQRADVLSDAAQVVGWLGPDAEVGCAERVERHVEAGTAYDLLVRAVRR